MTQDINLSFPSHFVYPVSVCPQKVNSAHSSLKATYYEILVNFDNTSGDPMTNLEKLRAIFLDAGAITCQLDPCHALFLDTEIQRRFADIFDDIALTQRQFPNWDVNRKRYHDFLRELAERNAKTTPDMATCCHYGAAFQEATPLEYLMAKHTPFESCHLKYLMGLSGLCLYQAVVSSEAGKRPTLILRVFDQNPLRTYEQQTPLIIAQRVTALKVLLPKLIKGRLGEDATVCLIYTEEGEAPVMFAHNATGTRSLRVLQSHYKASQPMGVIRAPEFIVTSILYNHKGAHTFGDIFTFFNDYLKTLSVYTPELAPVLFYLTAPQVGDGNLSLLNDVTLYDLFIAGNFDNRICEFLINVTHAVQRAHYDMLTPHSRACYKYTPKEIQTLIQNCRHKKLADIPVKSHWVLSFACRIIWDVLATCEVMTDSPPLDQGYYEHSLDPEQQRRLFDYITSHKTALAAFQTFCASRGVMGKLDYETAEQNITHNYQIISNHIKS